MRKIFQIFFLFFIFLAFVVGTKAFSGDLNKKELSIGELKTSIKELKTKKEQIDNSWENFLKNNGGIKDFLRKNLNEEELNNILKLYKESNFENSKRKKIDFYKKLYPKYIEPEKKDKFFEYIKKEITRIDEQKNIKKDISEKTQILAEKKEKYEKVAQKKEEYYFGVVLKNTIRKKIRTKLDEIEAKDSFKRLKNSKKIFLYTTFIDKIEQKKKEFEKKLNLENKKNKRKILILEIFKEELEKSIKRFQENIN